MLKATHQIGISMIIRTLARLAPDFPTDARDELLYRDSGKVI